MLAGQPVDARSDQFSFCVSLYEALYGKRPFESTASLATQGRPSVPRGTEVPEAIHEVLARGLAHDPDDRWSSMDALLAALRQQAAPRRRRGLALMLMGGVAATCQGLAAYAVGSRTTRKAFGGAKTALALARAEHVEHQVEALVLLNIGSVLREDGTLDEALTRQQESLTIREQALGPEHPDVAKSLLNLGAVLREQGKLDEALAGRASTTVAATNGRGEPAGRTRPGTGGVLTRPRGLSRGRWPPTEALLRRHRRDRSS